MDRLMVGIDREVVGSEELDAVAVRIAQIEEEGVGDAVTPGPRSIDFRKPVVASTSQIWMMSVIEETQTPM